MHTKRQKIGLAVRQAKSEARFRIIRDASDEGLSIQEAALKSGLTVSGVQGLIYKKKGTQKWPMA